MTDLVDEFKVESLVLVKQMGESLELCETGQGKAGDLEKFAQLADRIMGSAQQIGTIERPDLTVILLISKFAELCKILGYKTSKLPVGQELYRIAVGVLLDAHGELDRLIAGLSSERVDHADQISTTLIERLKWLNLQFSPEIQGGVPISQVEALFENLSDSSDQATIGKVRPK